MKQNGAAKLLKISLNFAGRGPDTACPQPICIPMPIADYLLLGAVSLVASGLTFFSGFGLGTLLMPFFALFFPLPVAIGLTAVVHLLNNVFKLGLTWRHIHWPTVWRFGLPGLVAALVGAWALAALGHVAPLATYTLGTRLCNVTPVGLVVGALLAVFAAMEFHPRGKKWQFGRRWLWAGGALSGFFGGLSGHQGALRTAFLVRVGLSKEALVATGIGIACCVDVARLALYAAQGVNTEGITRAWPLLLVATASAFAGAYMGNRLIKKVTLPLLQRIVAVFLGLMALALMAGVV